MRLSELSEAAVLAGFGSGRTRMTRSGRRWPWMSGAGWSAWNADLGGFAVVRCRVSDSDKLK